MFIIKINTSTNLQVDPTDTSAVTETPMFFGNRYSSEHHIANEIMCSVGRCPVHLIKFQNRMICLLGYFDPKHSVI